MQANSYRPPFATAPPYCHALPVAPNRLESLLARKPIRRRIWQYVLQVSCWPRGAKAVCDVLMGVVALALGCVSIQICSLRTEVLHVSRLPLAIGSLLN